MTGKRKGQANGRNGANRSGAPPVVRCAIYCRRSVEETSGTGALASTEVQRDACLNYIASQREQGWVALDEVFIDSGFSGGTMQRPALQRLLSEVQACRVQVVITHRADRLSRRILDFLQLVELFDKHGVGFVSVTEQFNTSTPGGRLYQHMLLSFAEYERSLVSERTALKLRAARRKGRFVGGGLILGYDLGPHPGHLVVNQTEAKRVVAIFKTFLGIGSLIETVQTLNRRRWTLKRWTTKGGSEYGGGAFDVHNLRRMLTNPAYVGEVDFEGVVYPAEHAAIVERATWDAVQELIATGSRGPRRQSSKNPALLAGILRCSHCDASMTRMYSQKDGRRYFYYQCIERYRRGRDTCPTSNLAARKIEAFVVEKIRAIGADPELVEVTVEQARVAVAAQRSELESEIRVAQKALDAAHDAARANITAAGNGQSRRGRDVGTGVDVAALEERLGRLREELAGLTDLRIDPDDLRTALASFDPVWDHLTTVEQARIVQLLIDRIDYDGAAGRIAITFSAVGVRTLAAEAAAGVEVTP